MPAILNETLLKEIFGQAAFPSLEATERTGNDFNKNSCKEEDNDENLNLKSWFTVADAIEAARGEGFLINESEVTRYLNIFVSKKYIERRESIAGTQYHLCVFSYMMKV